MIKIARCVVGFMLMGVGLLCLCVLVLVQVYLGQDPAFDALLSEGWKGAPVYVLMVVGGAFAIGNPRRKAA